MPSLEDIKKRRTKDGSGKKSVKVLVEEWQRKQHALKFEKKHSAKHKKIALPEGVRIQRKAAVQDLKINVSASGAVLEMQKALLEKFTK